MTATVFPISRSSDFILEGKVFDLVLLQSELARSIWRIVWQKDRKSSPSFYRNDATVVINYLPGYLNVDLTKSKVDELLFGRMRLTRISPPSTRAIFKPLISNRDERTKKITFRKTLQNKLSKLKGSYVPILFAVSFDTRGIRTNPNGRSNFERELFDMIILPPITILLRRTIREKILFGVSPSTQNISTQKDYKTKFSIPLGEFSFHREATFKSSWGLCMSW